MTADRRSGPCTGSCDGRTVVLMTYAGSQQSGTGPSTRRAIGILALIVAAFSVLVLPKVLSAGLTGIGSATIIPEPPPIGSCVLVEPTAVTPVACEQAHDGEVAMSWAAGILPEPTFVLNRNYSMIATDAQGKLLPSDPLCAGWGSQYVGTIAKFGPALWAPVDPSFVTTKVVAPPGFGTDKQHWVACLVGPGKMGPYVGTVRDSGGATGSARPDIFGWCFSSDTVAASASVYANCAQPHRIEQLATFIPTQQMFYANTITVETTWPEIEQGCLELATQMIGAVDPTFGGQLQIRSAPVSDELQTPQTGPPQSGLRVPDCFVSYVGGGELTGTVVGLGHRALPVSR